MEPFEFRLCSSRSIQREAVNVQLANSLNDVATASVDHTADGFETQCNPRKRASHSGGKRMTHRFRRMSGWLCCGGVLVRSGRSLHLVAPANNARYAVDTKKKRYTCKITAKRTPICPNCNSDSKRTKAKLVKGSADFGSPKWGLFALRIPINWIELSAPLETHRSDTHWTAR